MVVPRDIISQQFMYGSSHCSPAGWSAVQALNLMS